jgi:hypothetical protein
MRTAGKPLLGVAAQMHPRTVGIEISVVGVENKMQ